MSNDIIVLRYALVWQLRRTRGVALEQDVGHPLQDSRTGPLRPGLLDGDDVRTGLDGRGQVVGQSPRSATRTLNGSLASERQRRGAADQVRR